MEEIKDLNIYNSRMEKGLIDKLFFLDMIPNLEKVFDYGCANGALLNAIRLLRPDILLYGYDNNEDMIKMAESAIKHNINISTDLKHLKKVFFEDELKNSVLNLSSVIHEIYSYSSAKEIDDFWNFVYSSGYHYIAIRDMMLSPSANRSSFIKNEMKVRTSKILEKNQISDFEAIFGSIANNKNLVHFLLKYRYKENWNREVKENYFPISTNQFFENLSDKYEVLVYNTYQQPFLVDSIKEDFGIDMQDNTHVKILLKLKS